MCNVCAFAKLILLVIYPRDYDENLLTSLQPRGLFFLCVVGMLYLYEPGENEATPTPRITVPFLIFHFSLCPFYLHIVRL